MALGFLCTVGRNSRLLRSQLLSPVCQERLHTSPLDKSRYQPLKKRTIFGHHMSCKPAMFCESDTGWRSEHQVTKRLNWSSSHQGRTELLLCGVLAWLGLVKEEKEEDPLTTTVKRGILEVRVRNIHRVRESGNWELKCSFIIERKS